jgi:hypothetical protein
MLGNQPFKTKNAIKLRCQYIVDQIFARRVDISFHEAIAKRDVRSVKQSQFNTALRLLVDPILRY